MSKKKKKNKTNIVLKLFGIFMLILMVASPIISILAYALG